MKRGIVLTLTLVLIAAMAVTTANAQEVHIPDENLAAAIRQALGLPTNAVITADAMLNLTELDTVGKGIADLTGLEHATQLTSLRLWETAVSDVSPLANLTTLETLDLFGTAV